jgi:hypothetical protein
MSMANPILHQFTSDTVFIIFYNSFLLTLIANVSVTLTKRLVSVVLLSLYALSIVPISTAQRVLPCILPGTFCAHEVFLSVFTVTSFNLSVAVQLLVDVWAP